MPVNLLEIHELTKHYAGITALNGVSFSVREGETHAIVGENGAGKSTLIKILTGAEIPSSGSILFGGEKHEQVTPHLALEHGIVAIYQELNLIPSLTVAENIFFGCELMKGPFRDTAKMNAETIKMFSEMKVDINPESRILELGVAFQQIVEIVKAVSKNAKLLIMDEPTAPLTQTETKALYDIVGRLKAKGVTIIFISHRLEEVFDLCDRVTVMRDGLYIETREVANTSRNELVSLMVGRELVNNFPERDFELGDTILSVSNLKNKKLRNISFELRKGEILGFGGLVGAGRTEMAHALYGVDELESGTITLNGKTIRIKNPENALSHGIGLIPEDRKNSGLILGLPIGVNVSFSVLKKLSKNLIINARKELELYEEMKKDLQIKAVDPSFKVNTLSGGNQQKVVLAKILALNCDIVIFDEPTRGIDVGAKQEIYNLMRELTRKGKSIIMISSEMPELIGMSDRILVMQEGLINGELERSKFSQEQILHYACMESEERS